MFFVFLFFFLPQERFGEYRLIVQKKTFGELWPAFKLLAKQNKTKHEKQKKKKKKIEACVSFYKGEEKWGRSEGSE